MRQVRGVLNSVDAGRANRLEHYRIAVAGTVGKDLQEKTRNPLGSTVESLVSMFSQYLLEMTAQTSVGGQVSVTVLEAQQNQSRESQPVLFHKITVK